MCLRADFLLNGRAIRAGRTHKVALTGHCRHGKRSAPTIVQVLLDLEQRAINGTKPHPSNALVLYKDINSDEFLGISTSTRDKS